MTQLFLPFGALNNRRRRLRDWPFCIYCGSPADTRDHVPPKLLLEEPRPNNLRTAPACQPCNASWSLDEEYLGIALAQVGHYEHLTAKVARGGSVDRALVASPRLDDLIIKALNPGPDGRIWFTPDIQRIARITTKIAFGLYCLRYGLNMRLDDFQTVWISGPEQEVPEHLIAAQFLWPGTRRKRWTVVQHNVFEFLFAKGWMAEEPPLYCLLNLHNTIFAAISCPPAAGRIRRRLSARPWA